jgi:phosphoribosylanthranilate isomerase
MIDTTGNHVVKEFQLVIDPRSLPYLADMPSRHATATLQHLRHTCGIKIELLALKCTSGDSFFRNTAIADTLTILADAPVSGFQLHEAVEKKMIEGREKLPEMEHELSLLALSESSKADGIVTNSVLLIDHQYVIYQYHRIRIVPVGEFPDLIRVVAVGNSIFWSSAYGRDIGFDIFYQMTHWKAMRLFKWWAQAISGQTTKELVDNLRGALLNRFPYILYSRDMVRFYQLQRDYYTRRQRLQMYGLAIGFYINTFYLMLWGMLDHLTVVAKHARHLDIPEKVCGIRSKEFWKVFRGVEDSLAGFVKGPKMTEWIVIMADMRHQAAHNMIPIPSLLVFETEDSKKTDDEIVEILKKEKPHLYQFLNAASIETMQPSWIADWRMKKMEIAAPSMVMISKPDGRSYMRDPVISVDYDLSYLIAVMDAFLVALFK